MDIKEFAKPKYKGTQATYRMMTELNCSLCLHIAAYGDRFLNGDELKLFIWSIRQQSPVIGFEKWMLKNVFDRAHTSILEGGDPWGDKRMSSAQRLFETMKHHRVRISVELKDFGIIQLQDDSLLEFLTYLRKTKLSQGFQEWYKKARSHIESHNRFTESDKRRARYERSKQQKAERESNHEQPY